MVTHPEINMVSIFRDGTSKYMELKDCAAYEPGSNGSYYIGFEHPKDVMENMELQHYLLKYNKTMESLRVKQR